MKRKSARVVTEASQSFSFTRRAMILSGAQIGLGALLAGRMGWLSIAQNERYRLLAESNRVNLTLIPPRRGWIVDRYGKPLAINRTDFRVDIIPDRMKDADRTIAMLRGLLGLSDDEIARIRTDLDHARGYQPVQVAENLDWERYAAVSVRLNELPGVAPARGYSRYYPAGAAVGHLIGYVGAASAEEYEESRNPLLITPGYKIGKDGIEKTMESVLAGKPGARRTEVTARGKLVRDLATRPDVSGKTLNLTIDAGMQEYAARRLGDQSGSIVVMDCETGELLTMASMPSFDPNSFSDGISQMEWGMLSQDDHVPLRNKVLKGLYPPGSTVKPMVALALMGAGIDPERTTTCTGQYRLGSGRFHCWKRGGHGTVNMAKGIYQSCDVYFYHFALEAGIDAIATMAHRLGLGESFPLPLPSQSYGTVPDTAWKKRKYDKPWQQYDTVNATIGQGYMLSNVLQLAVMASRIASGRAVMPTIVRKPLVTPAEHLPIPPEHLAYVRQAMSDVVNGPGTAGRARLPFPDIKVAGKTGTAQVRRITMAERAGGVRSNESLPWKFRDHGLFIAFAPIEKPRYAAAVIIEHGGGSGAAYPVARDVLTYAFDKAKALEVLDGLEKQWGGDIATRMAAKAAAYRAARSAPAAPAPPPTPTPSPTTDAPDNPE
ncbi:MAG: penicillin-binding protein 2 [Sphingomonas sp. SCN 67-18]|uniref:penicillin-binding protein 2 n=1 Tax=uncultured Sphingomonas sp. TaxID=158754 RepID=UPI00086A9BCC|nr:penicillin-binding protein 2 [Sphingomonas sp. SCN 67-18]ODU21174.1 MAG: penicillin-binding protein 2 [Sphingomonas sp. SCN 67-18]